MAAIRPTLLLVLGAILAGPAFPSCLPEGPSVDSWKLEKNRVFSIRIPPAYRERKIQGIDSFIGQWVRGKSTIQFNYGPRFGNRPTPQCEEEIAGVRVGIDRAALESGMRRVTAQWSPDADPASDQFLSVWAEVETEIAELEALSAIRSVVLLDTERGSHVAPSRALERTTGPCPVVRSAHDPLDDDGRSRFCQR